MADGKSGHRWDLTPRAFHSLLDRLAADGRPAAAAYEELRHKLIEFFEGRRAPQPDAHADLALDRVARKLREGEPIDDVRRYSFGVARMLVLEAVRREGKKKEVLAELHSRGRPEELSGEDALKRLDKCLACLPLETQALIVDYYGAEGRAEESRAQLAERLGISYAALRVRAHRARAALEKCLRRPDPL